MVELMRDKVEFLCDKFGWKISSGGMVIQSLDPLKLLFVDVFSKTGFHSFALYAVCEAENHAVSVSVEPSKRLVTWHNFRTGLGESQRVDDNNPTAVALAIVEALYKALGGEDGKPSR